MLNAWVYLSNETHPHAAMAAVAAAAISAHLRSVASGSHRPMRRSPENWIGPVSPQTLPQKEWHHFPHQHHHVHSLSSSSLLRLAPSTIPLAFSTATQRVTTGVAASISVIPVAIDSTTVDTPRLAVSCAVLNSVTSGGHG